MSDQREPVPDYVVEFLDAVGRLVQAAADHARQQPPRLAVELTGAVNIGFQASGDLTVVSAPATAPVTTPPVHAVFATDSALAVDDAGVEVITAAVSSIGAPLIEQVRAWLQTVAREHPGLAGFASGLAVNATWEAMKDPEQAAEVVSVLLKEIMGLAALVIYYLSQ